MTKDKYLSIITSLSACLVLTVACKTTTLQSKTAKQEMINSVETLYQAVIEARPGDKLYLEDGNYKDIKLVVTQSGEAERPIHIVAKHPGKVFFTGDAKVELRGEHLILEGVCFKDGNRNVDNWSSHGPGLVAIYGSYNRVTNCAFDAFDEANSAYITTSLTADGKVPQHCRIDHCSFTNKITFDQVINLNNTFSAVKDGQGGPPMYHRIDHNFFSNPPKPGNAGGAIRIGYYRNDTGRCLVDSNLFMRQDSEPEIITSKSQENVYYANTFLDCQGTLNFRHGDHQVAIGNFFIGNDTKFGYGGMFVWGSKHVIASNYFELAKTISSRGNAALYLNPGAVASEHALAYDLLIANNQFVNINGYAIHFNPLDERRKEYCKENNLTFQTPHDLTLTCNLFYSNIKTTFPFFRNDYADDHGIVWKNNILYGRPTGIKQQVGIEEVPFVLSLAHGFHPENTSTTFQLSNLTNVPSIQGIDLDINALANRGIKGRPLSFTDVGTSWQKELPAYALSGKLPAAIQERFDRVLKRNR